MTTPSQVKGDKWERDLVDYFKSEGFDKARRCYGAGVHDGIGDILGIDLFTIEAKDQNRIDLAEWVDQAERQRHYSLNPFSVVIAKRRRKKVADAYAVIPLFLFIEIARRLAANG